MENKSGEKLLTIFEYVVLSDEPLRLVDVANGLELNRATALRFLTTLVNAGYIEQDPDPLRYAATYKICALANHVNRHEKLRDIADPYLLKVAEEWQESVNMSVESDMRAVYIDVIQKSNRSLITFQQVGTSAPMHCTGNGKLLLLNYTGDMIDTLISARGLKKYTDHTITTREGLLKELAAIRERGYAYDEEEREPGIRCISFPIYDVEGRVIAGMSVSGPRERMTDACIEEHIGSLRDAADQISRKLGYRSLTK